MATRLIDNLVLVEGEDIMLEVEPEKPVSAMIYRSFGMMLMEPPPVPEQAKGLLDDEKDLAAARERNDMEEIVYHDDFLSSLIDWPDLAADTAEVPRDRRMIIRVSGGWSPPVGKFPFAIWLTSDIPDGGQIRWPAKAMWFWVRPPLIRSGVETLIGVEWDSGDVPKP